MSTVIGENIKKLREVRSWTQEHLAAAAVVTERTVQRAEAGQPIAAESLQSIAAAFDVSVAELRRDNVAEAHAQELRNYDAVPLLRVKHGPELGGFLPSHGHMVDVVPDEGHPPSDALIAELHQQVADIGDLWQTTPPIGRLELLQGLRPSLVALEVSGYSVSAGLHRMKVVFPRQDAAEGPASSMTWETLLLVIARDTRPTAVVDRRAMLDGLRRM